MTKDGKKTKYYLTKNEFFKDAHSGLGICTASKDSPVKVEVTGTCREEGRQARPDTDLQDQGYRLIQPRPVCHCAVQARTRSVTSGPRRQSIGLVPCFTRDEAFFHDFMTNQVLIVGASTRAAAFSALRAGLEPRCVDYFADRDLWRGLPRASRLAWRRRGGTGSRRARLFERAMVLYRSHRESSRPGRRASRAGIASLATRPRFFAPSETPFVWRTSCAGTDCRVRTFAAALKRLPRDGTWLEKPVASGGGRLIRPLEQARDILHPSQPIFRSASREQASRRSSSPARARRR